MELTLLLAEFRVALVELMLVFMDAAPGFIDAAPLFDVPSIYIGTAPELALEAPGEVSLLLPEAFLEPPTLIPAKLVDKAMPGELTAETRPAFVESVGAALTAACSTDMPLTPASPLSGETD